MVTKVGDKVRFTTENTETGVVFSSSFDNLGFALAEGPIQTQVDERNADAAKEREEAKVLEGAMEKVKALTPEELRVLREVLKSQSE
ncbi:hypothetical protein D3C71_2100540 [compost metagenome]